MTIMRQPAHLLLSAVALLALLPAAVSIAFDDKEGDDPVEVEDPKTPLAPVDFEKQILPLLKERCFVCHAAGQKEEPKAGLRLDGKNWILTGGEKGGPAIRPGKPGKSPLYDHASRYYEAKGVMPPDGNIYARKELRLIERWIEEGAKFGTWTGKGGIDAPKPDRNSLVPEPPKPFEVFKRLGKDLPPAAAEAIKTARTAGVSVSVVYPGSPLLRVQFVSRNRVIDDASLKVLSDLRDNVAILVLRGAKITDASMEEIGRLRNLVRLEVPRTAIADEGLKTLAKTKLQELTWLDLHETAITDKGLAHLDYPKLHTLFIRNTKATAAGAEVLGKRLPKCRIYWKPKLPKPDAKSADADDKKKRDEKKK